LRHSLRVRRSRRLHPHRFRTLVLLALLSLVLPSLRLEGTPSARVDHKGAERVTAAQL